MTTEKKNYSYKVTKRGTDEILKAGIVRAWHKADAKCMAWESFVASANLKYGFQIDRLRNAVTVTILAEVK